MNMYMDMYRIKELNGETKKKIKWKILLRIESFEGLYDKASLFFLNIVVIVFFIV